ncbi:MAG: hypothetical protein D6767_09605 [Candidatus Hydrogenedentota bacterium]|nr:MAG: hypothetical protein D6767_09605 [Candidatus Hydrogenedentota bacterium]
MKKYFLVFIPLFLHAVPDQWDLLSQKEKLTLEEAAFFIASYKGYTCSQGCLKVLRDQHIDNSNQKSSDFLTRATLAQWLHRSFQLPKGLWYSITGWGRYAHADMQALGIMSSSKGDFNFVSGEALIGILETAAEKEAFYRGNQSPNALKSFASKKTNTRSVP